MKRKPPTAAWAKRLQLPGYDPVATAGDCWFDPDRAQRAVDFFNELLTFTQGARASTPFVLETWQVAIVANIVGWRRPDDTRRYRRTLIFIPRKNGKTELAAGLLLLVLCTDNEPGAEIYGAAGSRDQARLVFNRAKAMVLREPELAKRLRTFRTAITYEDGPYPASYKILSSDAKMQHGLNIHCAVIDELHVQGTDELVGVIETGTASRRQPLVVYLTTAGLDEESIGKEIYEEFRRVRDGEIDDPAMLPAIWEAPRDADIYDEAVWATANPNLGVSVSIDYLRGEAAKAKRLPRVEQNFRQLHLNQWVSSTAGWLSGDLWDACNGEHGRHELAEMLKGRPCYGGLDLSATTDLTSFSLVFPPEGIDPAAFIDADADAPPQSPWYVLVWSWLPQEAALGRSHRRRVREAPYDRWSQAGFLTMTDGGAVDYSVIRKTVNDLAKQYDIREIGYDPYNAEYVANQQLGQQDGLPMVVVRQGFLSLSSATKMFEALLLRRELLHGADPVLRWAALNAMLRYDANDNFMVDKKKSTSRIDPLAATIIAMSRAIAHGAVRKSVYEERGLFVL